MKTLHHWLLMAAAAAALGLTPTQSSAQQERQGRGNFDPEQFRQRMMERYREELKVKDDAEWKIIEGRIDKVMTARRDVGGPGGFRGGPGGRGPGGGNGGGNGGGGGGGGGRGDRDRDEGNPEAAALRAAIEANAPADEIKTKLAKVRETRKTKQAALEAAQAELKKVLSVKQEGTAVLMGLLP